MKAELGQGAPPQALEAGETGRSHSRKSDPA